MIFLLALNHILSSFPIFEYERPVWIIQKEDSMLDLAFDLLKNPKHLKGLEEYFFLKNIFFLSHLSSMTPVS